MKNFLDLPLKLSSLAKAQFVIIPFPLEKTPSYGKGTASGPAAVIKAYSQVELWDEELNHDPSLAGIATLPIPKVRAQHQAALEQLAGLSKAVYKKGQFPIVIGGEHSLTSGALKGFLAGGGKGEGLTIFHLDAHADLRDTWEGSKLSHACALRRVFELSPFLNLVQVGIRNISESEMPFWRAHQDRIKTFFARDKKHWDLQEIISYCKSKVYLTFDVDALDSSLMPSTGTPEPGGLFWDETLDILKALIKERALVGADVTEFSPIKGFSAPDFVVAKLIFKIISYIVGTSKTPNFKHQITNKLQIPISKF